MKLGKKIKKIAVDVLINEAQAIEALTQYIDNQFEAAVLEILQLQGRVVVTGIGKSANIGHKLVATFNSTGTPSLFMHAADAIHGDLGMIQHEDIVLCISKSGNTEELKVLVPLIRQTSVKIIALVSNTDSYLAKQADFVLNATIGEEACPHNLAPTTSTTAHLARGAALAVSLLEARGYTAQDFARYHPGGSLGKRLYLTVDDLVHTEKPLVQPDTPIREVIMEISSRRLGAAAVVDEGGILQGIITDGDLRRMLERFEDLSGIIAGDIMSGSPRLVESGTMAIDALELMERHNISQLLVVTKQKELLGFVHLHDFLKEGII